MEALQLGAQRALYGFVQVQPRPKFSKMNYTLFAGEAAAAAALIVVLANCDEAAVEPPGDDGMIGSRGMRPHKHTYTSHQDSQMGWRIREMAEPPPNEPPPKAGGDTRSP